MPKPEYLAPGVYVGERPAQTKPIEGVPTSTAGFIGLCQKGPYKTASPVTSLGEFERTYGKGRRPGFTWHAARAFFEEGGRRLYVARARRWTIRDCRRALKCLEAAGEISTVAAPGSSVGGAGRFVAGLLIDHAERMRYRFAVLDSAPGQSVDGVRALRAGLDSSRAALYYPWVRVKDPAGTGELSLPPSGFVAGIYARGDAARGVAKAPANEAVRLAVGLDHALTEAEGAALNAGGINCIRSFGPGDVRVWGARTLSADADWKYINVRRLSIFLEESIDNGTQWAVFEANGEPLWANVRRAVQDFLINEWRSGSLQGTKPEEAFFVKCDRTTMTQADIDQGRLICVIGAAVVKPAEFVIFRIGQWTADRPPSPPKRRRAARRRPR